MGTYKIEDWGSEEGRSEGRGLRSGQSRRGSDGNPQVRKEQEKIHGLRTLEMVENWA